ncbi:MAG TPA: type 4 pilus major pilin [Noviherbaspirillum sp.]|nr:type 4 pilus major pilin [Noviherbaspirillum sp.]
MKHLQIETTSGPILLHRQRGASLLEGIAYLGVAAIVVLGAVSLLTNAFATAQSNRVIEELTSLRTTVKKLYMGQPAGYGTGNINANLVSARVFPATLAVVDTDTVRNGWNGEVTVTGATSTFIITYSGVPQTDCINLLTGATGWTEVEQSAGTPTSITTFPVTLAQATAACNVTAASGNTLNFEST